MVLTLLPPEADSFLTPPAHGQEKDTSKVSAVSALLPPLEAGAWPHWGFPNPRGPQDLLRNLTGLDLRSYEHTGSFGGLALPDLPPRQ